MAPTHGRPNRPLAACNWFRTAKGCHYGGRCKFSHEIPSSGAGNTHHMTRDMPNPREQDNNPSAKFRVWRSFIAEDRSSSVTLPLPARFFLEALSFVDGDVATMQETVLLLAREGGLQRIKQVTDRSLESLGQEQRRKYFHEQVMPLLKIITHPQAMASALLDTAIGTINNFLYGQQGQRAVKFFGSAATMLQQHLTEDDDATGLNVGSVVSAFSNVIDSNTHTLVNENLAPIAHILFDLVQSINDSEARQVQKTMHRVNHRLGLGRQLASPKPSKAAPHGRAIFALDRDLPGDQSKGGRRHDNDHTDACNIQIMPTSDEIRASRSEYLPTADQHDWHLPGVAGLLDRNFRLLREDTVGQLRDAIRHELDASYRHSRGANAEGSRKLTYENVLAVALSFSMWQGLLVTIRFEQPPHLRRLSANARRDWWESSKRLRPDSLICLLSTSGSVIFCSVVEPRNPATAGKAGVAEPAGPGVQDGGQQPGKLDLFTSAEHGFVSVSLVDANRRNVDEVLKLYKNASPSTYKIVEFPGVLLPSFEPTLKALQSMLRSQDLPFAEYLVINEDTDLSAVAPPDYATKPDFRFDVGCIMKGGQQMHLTAGDEANYDAFRTNSELDKAQADALLASLNRSMALIQGPPGTGKSFTGVALIKVLLKNHQAARLGPILCVCYTNHALDQLLEDLVRQNVSQKIIRMGSRSKSELLKDCNLSVLAKAMDLTRAEKQENWLSKEDMSRDENDVQTLIKSISQGRNVETLKKYLEVCHPDHYDFLFSDSVDEEGFQTVSYSESNLLRNWLRGGSRGEQLRPEEVLIDIPLHHMSHRERQQIYGYWQEAMEKVLHEQLFNALAAYGRSKQHREMVRASVDLRCLQQADIIGVTTTGLARSLPLLRKLKVKVLVCEEAGEVLEAHILTALLPTLEHAILIGDHLQLPPHIQSYGLSRENPAGQRYSLDVSLFERLVSTAGSSRTTIPFSSLEIQRRMHPSISELIRNTLYPNLSDSPTVQGYPEVVGLKKRLFWMDHEHQEDSVTEATSSFSHSNAFEVKMVTAMVSHIVRQGTYQANDIAVLTPYLGQLQKIRRVLQASFEISLSEGDALELEKQAIGNEEETPIRGPAPMLQKTSLLKALKVSTIDNFQGEEAKVVVISLVRSNDQNKCGFLRTFNRINVLLSRAKHGMYIFANSRTSGHVPMWSSVIQMLRSGDNFGPSLALQCARHPENVFHVSKPDDFHIFSPEGGCNLPCQWRLSCGHSCLSKCHSEMLHSAVKCLEDCPRSLRGCEHSCPNRCGDPCPPRCLESVNELAITLQCGHLRHSLPCWQAQDPSVIICRDLAEKLVPGCNHKIRVECCVDVSSEGFKCHVRCGAYLPCGHVCQKPCNSCRTKGDGNVVLEEHGICPQICGRNYTTCKHQCEAACHGGGNCPPCRKACEVSCSHSTCSRQCCDPCAPCAEDNCASSCPHGSCTLPCAAPCDWLPCSRRCAKLLECGHQCPTVCGEECPPPRYCQVCASQDVKDMVVDFLEMATFVEVDLDEDPCLIPPCGHIITTSSMDGHMAMSKYYTVGLDGKIVDILEHNEPFSVNELKVCSTCRGSLRKLSRYGRIVRRAAIDEATKKFIVSANRLFMQLFEKFHRQNADLMNTRQAFGREMRTTEAGKLALTDGRDQQLNVISKAPIKGRYSQAMRIRHNIRKYLRLVDIQEQPFKRVWDMVQHARKRQKTDGHMQYQPTVLQTSQTLQATALLLRCDLAILSDFLELLGPNMGNLDLKANRADCITLEEAARQAHQPAIEVEAHVFHAQFCLAEMRFSIEHEEAGRLKSEAGKCIAAADELTREYPGQTGRVAGDVKAVESMLKDSSFTSVVRDDEWRHVMAAMATEFRGTGHWYTCANGHPFTVGECGMPMEATRCPQCNAPVGGQNHRPAEGVQAATDLEQRFGRMQI